MNCCTVSGELLLKYHIQFNGWTFPRRIAASHLSELLHYTLLAGKLVCHRRCCLEQTPSLETKMGTRHRTVSFIDPSLPTCTNYLLSACSIIMVFYFLSSPPLTPKDISSTLHALTTTHISYTTSSLLTLLLPSLSPHPYLLDAVCCKDWCACYEN